MEFSNVSIDEVNALSDMSPEQQREFVRKLIHTEDSRCKAVFLNPETHERIDVKELIGKMSEEEAIDVILQAILSEDTRTMTLTMGDIKNLRDKFVRGECTDDELEALKMVSDTFMMSNPVKMQQHLTEVIIEMIHFAQTDIQYMPRLADILSAVTVISLINSVKSENGCMSKYDGSLPADVSEIAHQVGEDILDTWQKTCIHPLDKELIALGLLHMALKLMSEENIKMVEAGVIAEQLGIDLETFDNQKTKIKNGLENGSNEKPHIVRPATYQAGDLDDEDKEMRDMLKG